jgi:hypothetical protein
MKARNTAILTLGYFCLAWGFSAQAGTMADEARITNGGTGFMGVTQSVGQPRPMGRVYGAMPAGEASTMVNGQPNVDPNAPLAGSARMTYEQRTMGAAGAMPSYSTGPAAARNPSWGTPD